MAQTTLNFAGATSIGTDLFSGNIGVPEYGSLDVNGFTFANLYRTDLQFFSYTSALGATGYFYDGPGVVDMSAGGSGIFATQLTSDNGAAFTLQSIQVDTGMSSPVSVSGNSVQTSPTLTATGTLAGGGTVSQSFAIDSVQGLQTLALSGFANVTSVRFSTNFYNPQFANFVIGNPGTDVWVSTALNGDWNSATNWSLGQVPTALDTVLTSGTAAENITLATSAAIAALHLDASLQTLLVSGTLTVSQGVTIEQGALNVRDGGTLNAPGGITIDATPSVGFGAVLYEASLNPATSTGTINANIVNDNVIFDGNGRLVINGNITGAGFIAIEGNPGDPATLELNGVTSQEIDFDQDGTLRLDQAASVGSRIYVQGGFAGATLDLAGATSFGGSLDMRLGASLDLKNVAFNGYVYSGGTLALTEANGTLLKFGVTADSGGVLLAASDGHGGTLLTDRAITNATWIGGTGSIGLWSDAANWSTGVVPDASTAVMINGTARTQINLQGSEQAYSLDVSDPNANVVESAAYTLTLGAGVIIENGAYFAIDESAIVAPGGVTLETGGQLANHYGYGFTSTITGNVVNNSNSSLAYAYGILAGNLTISGSLTGTGTTEVTGRLTVGGAVAQTILMTAGGQLILDDPAAFTGSIIGLTSGLFQNDGLFWGSLSFPASVIDLRGLAAGAAATGSLNNGTLTVVGGGQTLTFNVAAATGVNLADATLTFSSDNLGGTDVAWVVGLTDTWTGAVSNDWTTGGNWSLGFAPGTYDTAAIATAAPAALSIASGQQGQAWTIDLGSAGETLMVAGKLLLGNVSQSLNGGTLALGGGTLAGDGSLNLDNGVITLADGGISTNQNVAAAAASFYSGSLTFGPNLTVTQLAGTSNTVSINAVSSFSNAGTINAAVAGGWIGINVQQNYSFFGGGFSQPLSFYNSGTINVSNGASIGGLLGNSYFSNGPWVTTGFDNTSTGNIKVTGGGSAAFGGGRWSNAGTISVGQGSTLTLQGAFSSLAGVSNNGGTLILDGSTSAPLGPVEVTSGLLVINPSFNAYTSNSGAGYEAFAPDYTGAITGAAITIDQGATLELQGYAAFTSISGSVDENTQGTITFGKPAATLKLDRLDAFAGTLAGLASGDVIDFVNTTVSGASFGASGLTVTASDGTTATYGTSGTVFKSQQVHLSSDGNGGTLLTLTPFSVAANTAILVQPNMSYVGGGNDQFYVTPTTISDTIDGGGNNSSLGVLNGGTSVMGANITGFGQVHLMGGTAGTTGFNFTANATQGLIVVGSLGNDVITVGDASQTIYTEGLNSVVKATAATAGALVAGVHGNPTLEVTGGGSATLNANDGHGMIVQIDQAMILNMGLTAFISAVAETSGSTVTAGAPFQTLVTLAGGTTFIGATARNTYADTL